MKTDKKEETEPQTPDTSTPKEEVSYLYGFKMKLSNDKVGQAFVMPLSKDSNAAKILKEKKP